MARKDPEALAEDAVVKLAAAIFRERERAGPRAAASLCWRVVAVIRDMALDFEKQVARSKEDDRGPAA